MFVENMWPVDTGLVSVGYDIVRNEDLVTSKQLDRVFVVRDGTSNFAVVAISYATGLLWVYRTSYGGWLGDGAVTAGRILTHAYVDGRNFFWSSGERMQESKFTGAFFTAVLPLWPAGITDSMILGICAAGNYLIAYTDEQILWSSLANPLSFSDTAGGAGRQIPNQLRGPIRTVVPAADGFIIYTTLNAVAAQATNDATRPWVFREIRDAGGVESIEQVTADSPAGQQYTLGGYGIQRVTMQRAETVFPDAADFLVSRQIELWNSTLNDVELLTANLSVPPRLTFISGRYLFISYAFVDGEYALALVHDTVLNRWGKLRIPHVDIVQIPGQTMWGLNTPTFSAAGPGNQLMLRENITFVSIRGSLRRVILYGAQSQSIWATSFADVFQGVAVFGRVQSRRGRHSTLHGVELHRSGEQQVGSTVLIPRIYVAQPGYSSGLLYSTKQQLAVVGIPASYQRWACRHTYEFFDVIMVGAMEISTLLLEIQQHGSR
jgi:hypothetical protein